MRWGIFVALLALVLCAGPAAAGPSAGHKAKLKEVATTGSIPPNEGKAETSRSAANGDVFAGIPRDEQLAIQSALLWAGDVTATTNGDDPMAAAIKNFQKRKKAKVTGVLTPAERAELVAAAKEREDRFGWRVVTDPATGIRIGLPTKMVPHAHPDGSGTRWSSTHGEVQVATFRIKSGNLPALFEEEKKRPGRQIDYSMLRPDNFIVSGLQRGVRKFSVRAQMRDGEIRGFTMLYDQMMETIVTPAMVAMASAFSPFPARIAPLAALARPVDYGTGIVVSEQGDIVTDRRNTQGCQVIVAAGIGNAERVAEDKDNGIALLRVYGARKLAPVSLARETPKKGELTLVGIPDPQEQDGARKLAEIKARLADANAIELRQPVPVAGYSGAAALDTQGRVLGMMETRNAVIASAEPSVPPVRLIGAGAIRDFLASNNVPLAPADSGADAKASVVRIICVRK